MNIIEKLRADAESTDDIGLCAEAADEIEALQNQLAEETKNKEQFERDWLECCDALARQRKQLEDYAHANIQDRQDLAACQAREKVLGLTEEMKEKVHDALAEALGDSYDCTRVWSAWSYGTMSEDDFVPVSERVSEIAASAIAAIIMYLKDDCAKSYRQPADDSALRAALKEERERCAKVCDEQLEINPPSAGHEYNLGRKMGCGICANNIRALGD